MKFKKFIMFWLDFCQNINDLLLKYVYYYFTLVFIIRSYVFLYLPLCTYKEVLTSVDDVE